VEEAVVKARAEGSERRLVRQLVTAADVYRDTGRLDVAAQMLREAERVSGAGSPAQPVQEALLERSRAELALARGAGEAAVAHARRSLEYALASHGPESHTLAAQLVVAEACNAHGEFEAARSAAESALGIGTRWLRELRHSLHVGQARLELGIALAGQGNREAGIAELTQAVEHLRASVGAQGPSTLRAQARLDSLAAPGSRSEAAPRTGLRRLED
jgi:hypothetical protein